MPDAQCLLGGPSMGRFFLILIVALGVGGALAYYNQVGPFAPDDDASHGTINSDGTRGTQQRVDVGGPLFAPGPKPVINLIPDPEGRRPRRTLTFADSLTQPIYKEDAS